MIKLLIVGIGGFCGAIARYGISGLIQTRWPLQFPFGTLTVNAVGCLIIGCIMSLVAEGQAIAAPLRLFLTMGLLGSFTTFSTLGYETFEFMQTGNFRLASYNIIANIGLGIGMVMLGRHGTSYLLS